MGYNGEFDGTQIGPDGERHPVDELDDVNPEPPRQNERQPFSENDLDLSRLATTETPGESYRQVTDLSAAVPLPSIPSWARVAMVSVEAQIVRWRAEAQNPTASVGMPLAAGSTKTFIGDATTLGELRFIQATSGAKLNVTYWR